MPGYVVGSVTGQSKAVNRAITGEVLRQAAGLAAYYAILAQYFGATPEPDPRSTKFGRLSTGIKKRTILDPLSGFGQVITFAARLMSGERKTATGEIVKERGPDVNPFQRSTFDTMVQFGRSKLNPTLGLGIDLISRQDFMGNYIPSRTKHFFSGFTPLALKDVYEVMDEEGIPRGILPSILAIMGEGVQVWDDAESYSGPKMPSTPSFKIPSSLK